MSLRPSSYEAAKIIAARNAARRKARFLASKTSPKGRFGRIGGSEPISRVDPLNGGNGIPEGENASDAKPRKAKKGFRSVTRDRADHYFSLFIRYRDNWTCQRCGTRYEPVTASLQCSHFFGRARENTRFDPLNADAQCAGCHNFLGANPEFHREWKLQKIGERAFALLRLRAESRCKKDRKLMSTVCKRLYEKEKARFEAERS